MLNKHTDKKLVWALFPETKIKSHARLIEQQGNGEYLLYCPVHDKLFTAKEIRDITKEERG